MFFGIPSPEVAGHLLLNRVLGAKELCETVSNLIEA